MITINIPDVPDIPLSALIRFESTLPHIISDEVPITVMREEAFIIGHNPVFLCAEEDFYLYCSTNVCIKSPVLQFVQFSRGDSTFAICDTIGSGTIYGDRDSIFCTLPDNIDYNSKYYTRLIDEQGRTSQPYQLNIIPQEISITTDVSDLEYLCTGVRFFVDYEAIGCFDDENIFSIVLSDVYGNFDTENAVVIGTIKNKTSGRIEIFIPLEMLEGDSYRIKLTSTHPQLEYIFQLNIKIRHPFIEIISDYFNVDCVLDETYDDSGIPKILSNTDSSVVIFRTSDCFGKDNSFVLEFGKVTSNYPDGDFTNPIVVSTCEWDEREFRFVLPVVLGGDAYRYRVRSTNPVIYSPTSSDDIRLNQPYIALLGGNGIDVQKVIICRNLTITLPYTTSDCFNLDNIFYLEISDENGNFNTPYIDFSTSLLKGEFVFNLPTFVQSGKEYSLRIRSTSPEMIFNQEHLLFIFREPEVLTGNLNKLYTSRNDTLYVPFNTNCIDQEGKFFEAQLSDSKGNFGPSSNDNILRIGNKIG